MGLFDFVKSAGQAILGKDDDKTPTRDLDQVLADKTKAAALEKLVAGMGFKVEDFEVKFRDGKATLGGRVFSRADREKLILVVGNTQGVAQVDDRMMLGSAPAGGGLAEQETAETESIMYTVKSGDSLSKIAKAHYSDAMKYMIIFEANTPMLKDPNKIYPGQMLRIPPLDK